MKKIYLSLSLALLLLLAALMLVSCSTTYEYKVVYYVEQPDGSYTQQKIEAYTTEESILNFEPAPPMHYKLNRAKSKLAFDLAAEEGAVVEVYYDAERYTVTFDTGALRHVSGDLVQSIFYGEDAVAPVVANTDKAKFLGWSKSFSDVEENITVTALTDTDATVLVYHKVEGVDGSYTTTLAETLTVDAANGAYTYVPTARAHYRVKTEDSTLTCTPSVNAETSVTVCYERERYTVRFELSGLDHLGGELTQTVVYGMTAALPEFSGNNKCSFMEWDGDVTAPITGDTVFTAKVNSRAYVLVKVYHQLPDGSFVLADTVSLDADARLGSYSYQAPPTTGYTLNAEKSVLHGELAVNTETELAAYYNINYYTVTFEIGGLTHVSGALVQQVAYGYAATAPTVENTATLGFSRWSVAFNAVTGDLTVTAVTTTDAPVKVIVYKEALNGDYVAEPETVVYANATLSSYTYAAPALNHYVLKTDMSVLTVTPSMLDTPTVKVYYERARYTVRFELRDLTHVSGDLVQTVIYGGSAVAPTVENTQASVFVSWDTAFTNVSSNLTVTANVSSDATVVLKYHYQTLDGGYTTYTPTPVTVPATLGSYTHAAPGKTGYNIVTTAAGATCTLYAGKESTVNIYYNLIEYTVTFVYDGLSLTEGAAVQTVLHGGAAVAPVVANSISGTYYNVFLDWDKSFDYVTADLTVTARTELFKPLYTRADLERVAVDLAGNYILMEDINLNNTTWTPLGTFTGKLIGNGKTISNLLITSADHGALFRENRGLIDGVTLANCKASHSFGSAGAAYSVESAFLVSTNYGTIKNCKLAGTNTVDTKLAIAYSYGFGGDTSTHEHEAHFHVGGLTCLNIGTMENCTLEGELTFNLTAYTSYTGSGFMENTGTGLGKAVSHSTGYFGGFSSENHGTIAHCTSNAAIKANMISEVYAKNLGQNGAYARTYLHFGTVANYNKADAVIDDCVTLAGTISKSTVSSGEGNGSYPSIQHVGTSAEYNTLVDTNYGTITRSVATTS